MSTKVKNHNILDKLEKIIQDKVQNRYTGSLIMYVYFNQGGVKSCEYEEKLRKQIFPDSTSCSEF